VGVPLDDATGIEVCDASGRPVPPGRVGQVVVTGPTVMVGYRHRPAETARFLREGRLFTGDLGRVDEEGFLHLRGTRLPLAKVNAQMVDLREIEALACARPGVAKACAQLVDDGPHSRLRLSVEPTTDSIVDPEALRGDLRAALSPHKVPQSIEIISRKRTVAQTSPGADDAQKP
jgi:acyl-CoA synthetase (AMP-forming)/AMP-acid ligase II